VPGLVPEGWEDAAHTLSLFMHHRLVVDAYLGGLSEEYIEAPSQRMISDAIDELAGRRWTDQLMAQTLGTQPAPWRLGGAAVREVITATAAATAHTRIGHLRLTPEVTGEAVEAVHGFVEAQGFGRLIQGHGILVFLDNHGAIEHYGGLAERDFVLGLKHRPWAHAPLDDELLSGMAAGYYRIVLRNGRRYVVNTARARRQFAVFRRALVESGYLKKRLELVQLSQFNLFKEWEGQARALVPDLDAHRRRFTAFVGLPPGARCLECGCGSLAQTFDGGLWEAVGPAGSIVALDPSPGMLGRAAQRLEREKAQNIELLCARAEEIPASEGSFDAAVGATFLHWCDAPLALAEMRRVTRPGGVVAICSPSAFATDMPWFREWFRPIFDIAERTGQPVTLPVFSEGDVARLFADAGLREIATQTFDVPWYLSDADSATYTLIQGVSLFQVQLEPLPWGARQDLIAEVRECGRRVCERTTPAERVLHTPLEFVRGVV
jgi:ubiquinone/menaquinone biosynthesis C-methylase UbiE